MTKINWSRLMLGGLVASIICFITDGLLHERLLAADWKAVYDNLKATEHAHTGFEIVYFVIFEIGRGFGSMFLYALMRSHFAPGPKTAALAQALPHG